MFDWTRPKSVRGALLAVVGAILIAGFTVTNLASYYVSKGEIRQSLANNELPLISDNIYSEIQQDLLPPVFVSSVMAADTFVKDWLAEGENPPQEMIRYLEEIRKKYGFFTSFLISENSRNYYHFSGVTQVISESDPRDAWYFRARDLTENYELNVDFNAEQDDALTIFINYRVVDDKGDLMAITGVGLDFRTVSRIVDRYRDYFGRNVYFIDQAGNIMVRSEGATISTSNLRDAPGLEEIAEQLLATDQGFFEYEKDGETLLVSTRVIPELKWRVLVEQRESDALASIQQSTAVNILIGAGVILTTFLVLIFAVNRFHSHLEWMATTDKLTGLNNRGVFDIVLDQAIKHFNRDGSAFSLIMLDIDHFKRVNDTLGHLKGDEVLQHVARLSKSGIRESDVLCRWGGEEFIILARDCDGAAAARKADSIRQAIQDCPEIEKINDHPVTVSLGVTEIKPGDSPDDILSRADAALYQAKDEGRNRVVAA